MNLKVGMTSAKTDTHLASLDKSTGKWLLFKLDESGSVIGNAIGEFDSWSAALSGTIGEDSEK